MLELIIEDSFFSGKSVEKKMALRRSVRRPALTLPVHSGEKAARMEGRMPPERRICMAGVSGLEQARRTTQDRQNFGKISIFYISID